MPPMKNDRLELPESDRRLAFSDLGLLGCFEVVRQTNTRSSSQILIERLLGSRVRWIVPRVILHGQSLNSLKHSCRHRRSSSLR